MLNKHNNDTVCKKCCFATLKGITQTGCSQKILDRYIKNGSNVLECYDEDSEFNVIEGRVCPFKRTYEWMSAHKDNIDKTLNKETQMSYLAIIFASKNMQDIVKTVETLESQSLVPAQIAIIQQKGCMIMPGVLKDTIVNCKVKTRLYNHLVQKTKAQSIHLAFQFLDFPFYAVFDAGYAVPQDFFQTINDFIIKGLGQFAAIKPEDGINGLVIPAAVHAHWYPLVNSNQTMLKIIEEWEECQNKKVCYSMADIKKA